MLALAAALVVLMLGSLGLGRYPIAPAQVIHALGAAGPSGDLELERIRVIVQDVRLPRVILTALCGFALGLSGAALQGAFRNPLVSPEVVGVQSGAAFGGVLGILLFLPPLGYVGLSFLFGLLATVAAFGLARLAGRASAIVLVLAGMVVAVFFTALMDLAKYAADPQSRLPAITYWMLGSFAGASFDKMWLMAGAAALGGLPLLLLRWRINLLALGEVDASALGVDVRALRGAVVALVALMTAAQVAVSGGVGWVGLIVPHVARMLIGSDHSRLLPASGLLGALYVLVLDDLARSAAQQEIPIGVLTALIGAPVFAVLLWRLKGRGWGET